MRALRGGDIGVVRIFARGELLLPEILTTFFSRYLSL